MSRISVQTLETTEGKHSRPGELNLGCNGLITPDSVWDDGSSYVCQFKLSKLLYISKFMDFLALIFEWPSPQIFINA